jgi:glutamate N-acetyltransferase/amino-acid N-acetyltransferase
MGAGQIARLETKMTGKSDDKYLFIEGGVCAPQGFHAAGLYAGFKKSRKKDLSLIYSETICSAAGAYTTNKVKGAALIVTKEHVADGRAQAVITNSGNANTCAANGMEIARETCALTGKALGLRAEDVLVCSTGVIGQPLSIEPFEQGIPKLAKIVLAGDKSAKGYGSEPASEAIMTTDKIRKEVAVEFKLGGKVCRIGGISKGSGMINPNMATMLAFLTTDVNIEADQLREALKEDINHSFNQISVDGDTSTNDTVVILANGMAGNRKITDTGRDFTAFCEALRHVTKTLARLLAKDGEGATKLIECRVANAPTDQIAMRIAKTVIQSDLVKTAIYGSDANWGRILCAIGYTYGTFNTDNVDVSLASAGGKLEVCRGSFGLELDEELAKKVLAEDEILILADLHDGRADAEAYGCDLTYEYVRINGMYRT